MTQIALTPNFHLASRTYSKDNLHPYRRYPNPSSLLFQLPPLHTQNPYYPKPSKYQNNKTNDLHPKFQDQRSIPHTGPGPLRQKMGLDNILPERSRSQGSTSPLSGQYHGRTVGSERSLFSGGTAGSVNFPIIVDLIGSEGRGQSWLSFCDWWCDGLNWEKDGVLASRGLWM